MAKQAKRIIDTTAEEDTANPVLATSVTIPADFFDGFSEITDGIAGFWNPAPGDAIRGTLLGFRDDIGTENGNGCYLIEVDHPAVAYPKDDDDATEGEGPLCQPGETVAVWASYTLEKLAGCEGMQVGIQYKGKEATKTKGRKVKLYRLFVKVRNVSVEQQEQILLKLKAPQKRIPKLPDGSPNLARLADEAAATLGADGHQT